MFVVMLFLLDLYTGRTVHGVGHRTPGHTFRPHMNGRASAATGIALTIANAARRQPARI